MARQASVQAPSQYGLTKPAVPVYMYTDRISYSAILCTD